MSRFLLVRVWCSRMRGAVLEFRARVSFCSCVSATSAQELCALVVCDCLPLVSSAIADYPALNCSRLLESCLRMRETLESSPCGGFFGEFFISDFHRFCCSELFELVLVFLVIALLAGFLVSDFSPGFAREKSVRVLRWVTFWVCLSLSWCNVLLRFEAFREITSRGREVILYVGVVIRVLGY